jgi:hypothetical protein
VIRKFASHIFGWATIAFVVNLAGTFALTEIRGSPNDPYAEEGRLAFLLIFGTLWVCIASFATMVLFMRPATASSLSPVLCGVALAIATLPLSALLNAPSITPNPIAALGGNLLKYDTILFASCIIEYVGITIGVGVLLLKLARSTDLRAINVVGLVWAGLAVLYVLQLPIALAISGNLH